MKYAAVEVKIVGRSGLLMHAHRNVKGIEKLPSNEQAELVAYRHPDTGELCIPAANIRSCLIGAAKFIKGRGRASLQSAVRSGVYVHPEYVGLGVYDYIIDERSVVVPSTKGRVMRYRPRLDAWECRFYLVFSTRLLSADQLKEVVVYAGDLIGLMDFRPEKSGTFGRFTVEEWKVLPEVPPELAKYCIP